MESDDAAVVLVQAPDGSVCSGVLISPRVVLTAAHCLAASVRNQIEGGEVGFGVDGQSSPRAIEAIFVHREFNGQVPPGNFDLGVVRLVEPAPNQVIPLDWLRAPDTEFVGMPARVLGFGVDNPFVQSGGGVRRTVDSTVFGVGAQHLYMGDISANSCRGDSGGPVLAALEPGGPEVVIALNSFGPVTCDDLSAKTRLDIHAGLLTEILAAWDGPCAFDGLCPADTSGCAFADPDCDACGLNGRCEDGCARVDLDCKYGGRTGDMCVRDSDCEGRLCDPEAGVCATGCSVDERGLPACDPGFDCVTLADETPVCRAVGGCSASGDSGGPFVIVLVGLVLIARPRQAQGSGDMLH